MGLGRDYREKILEDEHNKYLEEILNKEKEEWSESEARFMELYERNFRKDVNVIMIAVCVLIGGIFTLGWVIWQLIKAFI